LFNGFKPKFVRRYAQLEGEMISALRHYVEDVREGRFPNVETESFHVADEAELQKLYGGKLLETGSK
jgi:3-methyl-2-oxobutanoate hydroxymethyltransferase